MIKFLHSRTTSKKLLTLTLFYLVIISAVSIIAGFFFRSEAIFLRLIETAHALAGITIGFYMWKAKHENIHKYNDPCNLLDGSVVE